MYPISGLFFNFFLEIFPPSYRIKGFIYILFYLGRSVPEQSQSDFELIIETLLGKIRGTYINKYVVAWLSIPYAEPPLGKCKNN